MADPTVPPDPDLIEVDPDPVPVASQPHGDATSPQAHNSEIDSDAADHQLCGMTHLPSGRTCVLAVRHSGSCEFHAPS